MANKELGHPGSYGFSGRFGLRQVVVELLP